MLTLYVRSGCPFCAKVLRTVEGLNLTLDIKNIGDPGVLDEVIDKGGKDQVPFLWGEDGAVNIYESETIIRFLTTRFGAL
jgi:glutaredoxin